MANLLNQTKALLENHNKTPKDVSWIGSFDGEYAISWEEFEKIADIEYDAGFGAQEIATDLVIVFKDGTFADRGEYDGSEWWDYHKAPIKKPITKSFTNLGGSGIMWDDLATLNSSKQTEGSK